MRACVINKYGGIEEINRKFRESGRLENLMARLKKKNSGFLYTKKIARLIKYGKIP